MNIHNFSGIAVSVVVPSYKPEDYLWKCLDSIYHQTLSKEAYEVIFVLNGCNEPYYSLAKKYVFDNLPSLNIQLFQTDTPGVSNARNIGIENAQGEYIVFVDDDDMVSPNFLSGLLSVSSSESVGCCISYAFEHTLDNKTDNFITRSYKINQGKEFSLLRFRGFLSPPVCKLLHRDIIGPSRFPINLRKSEDSVFCLDISKRIKTMRLAPENSVYYQRKRVGSVTRSKTTFWAEFKMFICIEVTYVKIWLRHPLKTNVLFLFTRMAACVKNLFIYVRFIYKTNY